MSLISLLIALGAERVMLSKYWHFNFYFQHYIAMTLGFVSKSEIGKNRLNITVLALLPAALIYGFFSVVDETIIEFVLSTLILIVCFGCDFSREAYKGFLNAAMRGDEVAVSHYQIELQQDQAPEKESFGQTLVWLNYQYYMAIMLIFIVFGVSGVVFYRILVAISNYRERIESDDIKVDSVIADDPSSINSEANSDESSDEINNGEELDANAGTLSKSAIDNSRSVLFYLDFIPTRFAAFGYMLVGHFSKSSALWLEGFLNYTMPPREYLCEVAKKSEDCIINNEDLTGEPTLLVRLAKRNVLLLLAATAFMTIAGIIS